MTPDEIIAIASVISIVLVAVQAYLVYKIDKLKLFFESHLNESNIAISVVIEAGPDEYIRLENTGISIDELEAELKATINSPELGDLILKFTWQSQSGMINKESVDVRLHNKFVDFLQRNGFLGSRKVTFPQPIRGKGEKDEIIFLPDLVKPFELLLDVKVKSKLQGQEKAIRKTFKLGYDFVSEKFPEAEKTHTNYEVQVYACEGKFK